MHRLFRTCLAAAAALTLGLLLAACTIDSEKPLVADTEGATPLPDSFTFYPYQAADVGYTLSTDAPATFARAGNHYLATGIPDTKGKMDVRLVPAGDEIYLLAVMMGDEPEEVYGFARYTDGVLAIALTPDKATSAAIEKEHNGVMPQARIALAGLTVSGETDEITVKDRAALDYLTDMYVAGRLPMDKLSVGYVALDADAKPPSRLVPAGHDWLRMP